MLSFIKGLFKGIFAAIVAVALVLVGINAWIVFSSKTAISSYDEAVAEAQAGIAQTYDCIIVLGASVYADGDLSPILKNRVDAAIGLYNQGIAPVIVMSGDGREANYDEPTAMKEYAMAQGVPESAIYCDPGGYHTYDTMWRVANVYGATSALVVTQEYHLFRAVFDASGVGMQAGGVISDDGTYDDQLWYDVRECAGRIQDFLLVVTDSVPDNTTEGIER